MVELADYFGLHYSSVSKIVKRFEDSHVKTCPPLFVNPMTYRELLRAVNRE